MIDRDLSFAKLDDDDLDLDHREFTRLLIPYIVASTILDCLDGVVHDALQFLTDGILTAYEYHITLFDQVITDYRERFAPDA